MSDLIAAQIKSIENMGGGEGGGGGGGGEGVAEVVV